MTYSIIMLALIIIAEVAMTLKDKRVRTLLKYQFKALFRPNKSFAEKEVERLNKSKRSLLKTLTKFDNKMYQGSNEDLNRMIAKLKQ